MDEATPDEATLDEATQNEAKATVTNAELDEMLTNDLTSMGYTRDYFVQNQTASVQREKIREKAAEGVEVTDEQVQEEFDKRVATQKESYDANPAGYVTAENNGHGQLLCAGRLPRREEPAHPLQHGEAERNQGAEHRYHQREPRR